MEYINNDTVEFTELEALIAELHSVLLDYGNSSAEAVGIILSADVPPYLRSETPIIDSTMTPEFVRWLLDR